MHGGTRTPRIRVVGRSPSATPTRGPAYASNPCEGDRPARLPGNGAAAARYGMGDVADFLLKQVGDTVYVRKATMVSSQAADR